MFLEKLEIQGFKSFAAKTTLTFRESGERAKGVTAVVGPNGSGKSNVADAIRWVLGEQSLKLLRGKKSEDVIFSGSEKRARSGFAEVSLFLNNEDGTANIDYPELVITRRLYRDGESEYLVNNAKVRLQDIQLLLAKANFGERHYAVIGQGMIDSLLQLSPEERRAFFDEATGVKPYQIKKDQALSKLSQAEENLGHGLALLAEIEPRARSLARQVKRLEERDAFVSELQGLQHAYYLTLWRDLAAQLKTIHKNLEAARKVRIAKSEEANVIRTEFSGMERKETRPEAWRKLQQKSRELLEEQGKLRTRDVELMGLVARKEAEAAAATPLPLTTIIGEIRDIEKKIRLAVGKIEKAATLEEAKSHAKELGALAERSAGLVEKMERPPAASKSAEIDPAVKKERATIGEKLADIAKEIQKNEGEMKALEGEEKKGNAEIFDTQRRLEVRLAELRDLESKEHAIEVEMTRLETRRETLEQEMALELKERVEHIRREAEAGGEGASVDANQALSKIQKLKYQLELIGGIDPEVAKEYKETNERFSFLTTQTEDLRASINDLEKIIIELNRQIDEEFEHAFSKLSDDFGRYFRILFEGGTARLEKVKEEAATNNELADENDEIEEAPRTLAQKFASEKYMIDIFANPPGKKVKSISVLSGGERALTAIALISAIISNTPAPFVVLDEVDAALDESNAARFASIVAELSTKSQFIVITHNRYTMEKSTLLYGVTMRDDGTSQLLSVSLEDVKEEKSKTKVNV